MSIFSQRFYISSRYGFTLIELLVATSIIIIITTVLLFRHDRFNSATLQRSLTYGVALTIRQAQLYGTSVREFSGNFDAQSYGVQFVDAEPNATYYLFADNNNNGVRASDNSENVDTFSIQGGYEITDFCAVRSGSVECLSNGFIESLTISFRRPDPDACFSSDISSSACAPTGTEVYQRACVELSSPGGDPRSIEITNTGQISVGESGTAAADDCES